MAQYALPPGAVRRRTVFGLLDADGWKWASIKALFWFLLVIFLQGYVPDRAYYLTVSPTVDLGFNAISPVNLCPAENDRGDRKMPCPVPAGAILPWDASPSELALPEGRSGALTFNSGSTLYLIGGETGSVGTTASVITTDVSEDGNLSIWTDAPALPSHRSHATVLNLSGVPYVIGGRDRLGQPTQTVYVGTIEQGKLTGWTEFDRPVAASALERRGWHLNGRRAVHLRRPHARWPVGQGLVSAQDASGKPGQWVEQTQLVMPEPRAEATAANTGASVYILGGVGPKGVTNLVYYLGLDTKGLPVVNAKTEQPYGWGLSVNQSASAALPEPRAGATTFVNSGAIWVMGGRGFDDKVTNTAWWAVPNSADGTISAGRPRRIDLLEPRTGASVAAVGSHVFVIGGANDTGRLSSSLRASLAPQSPYFRLGLFGVTVPALSIKGEIGQQLGYIVAGSAALGNLVLLIIIGWMYSHKPETFRFFRFVTRGRFRPPPRTTTRPSPRSARSAADAHRSRWWSRAARRCRPRPTASTARLAGRMRARESRSSPW